MRQPPCSYSPAKKTVGLRVIYRGAESALVEEMCAKPPSSERPEAPATGSLPFDGQRRVSAKTAASDYQLPSVELLNEAQMRANKPTTNC